jgi:hypothetical protein
MTAILLLCLALFVQFIGIIRLKKYSESMGDATILEYTRIVKPYFLRFYFLGVIPLLVYLFLLMGGITSILYDIWMFGIASIIIDLFALYRLKGKIARLESKNLLKPIPGKYSFLLIGKLFMFSAMQVYIMQFESIR